MTAGLGKYTYKLLLLTVFAALTFYSCDDMDDSLNVPTKLEVQNFIWKGLNLYYLWQEDSPDLADDRFATQEQLNTFLTPYTNPLTLFNHLRVDPSIDRFSVLVDDYVYLENLFQGVAKSNGMELIHDYSFIYVQM
ncbi:MAG: hypothetical protein EOP50_10775 [Sphingobacteriales bacterium]|nr:MAG: hypothetical protein EOP50_10775 [Sphingobacteriales bacterium]